MSSYNSSACQLVILLFKSFCFGHETRLVFLFDHISGSISLVGGCCRHLNSIPPHTSLASIFICRPFGIWEMSSPFIVRKIQKWIRIAQNVVERSEETISIVHSQSIYIYRSSQPKKCSFISSMFRHMRNEKELRNISNGQKIRQSVRQIMNDWREVETLYRDWSDDEYFVFLFSVCVCTEYVNKTPTDRIVLFHFDRAMECTNTGSYVAEMNLFDLLFNSGDCFLL